MSLEEYGVAMADVPPKVRELLLRPDVRRVMVLDEDGSEIVRLPGTRDPDEGASDVMAAFGEAEGARGPVRVLADTSGLRRAETGVEGLGPPSEAEAEAGEAFEGAYEPGSEEESEIRGLTP